MPHEIFLSYLINTFTVTSGLILLFLWSKIPVGKFWALGLFIVLESAAIARLVDLYDLISGPGNPALDSYERRVITYSIGLILVLAELFIYVKAARIGAKNDKKALEKEGVTIPHEQS